MSMTSAPARIARDARAGPCVTAIRGAVFYPPVGLCARARAPLDPCLALVTTVGAAFVALSAVRPAKPRQR